MQNELPEEVSRLLDEHEETSADKLVALGGVIERKRSEAVTARLASGIEAVWMQAEENYHGLDDTNQGGMSHTRWNKPTTMAGRVTAADRSPTANNSNAFVRLTSRYVDAGAAKLTEILLPVGDKAFSFGPTPVPEIISSLKDTRQVNYNGIPLERDARPGEAQQLPGAASSSPGGLAATPPAAPPSAPGTPPAPPQVPLTVKDLAEEKLDAARTAAKKAETRIYDWMVESQLPAEMRKVIFDAARLGTGVLKGPYPKKKVGRALSKEGGKAKLEVKISYNPGYCWVDVWNIYPDPACGENIHNGDHLFEVDFFSEKQLRDLIGAPGYIESAIEKVIKAGPGISVARGTERPDKPADFYAKRYDVWYYYGTLTREDMLAANAVGVSEKSPEAMYAIVTMVNGFVIRATINPLESGEFPYHAVPWQRRAGFWAGVGVAEQLEMPQRAINAATRAMFNNAGKSAGCILVMDQGSVVPADGKQEITPDKIYLRSQDSIVDDVRKAFNFFQVPNITPQMMNIIEYIFRLAEESTNIPLVTQGQSGPTSPETFGAAQLQNNNANQLLRSIGYAFDDYITEPVVRQSYEMLLLDDEVPDEEKGDWFIDAHGSVALVERAIQDQTIQQMYEFVQNPAFGFNPKSWASEYMKSKHLSPKNFQYSAEEQAKLDAAPPPPPPAIQVAEIRSKDVQAKIAAEQQADQQKLAAQAAADQAAGQLARELAAGENQMTSERIRRDTDRDTAYVQAETTRTQNEYEARMRELEIKRELAILDYANKKDVTLDKVKADLAKEGMRLSTQRELAGVAQAVKLEEKRPPPQVATPSVEPPGKAAAGEAFQA